MNVVRQHFGLASLLPDFEGPTSQWELANPKWFATGQGGTKQYFCPEIKDILFEKLNYYTKKDKALVRTQNFGEPTERMQQKF